MTELPDEEQGPRRIKICVIGKADSPHEYNWSKALANAGHDVLLISPRPRENSSVALRVVPRVAIGPRIFRQVATMVRWLYELARTDADIFHAHYASDYGPWALALLGKKPLVLTAMGSDVLHAARGDYGRVTRMFTRFALRRAELVISHSTYVGEVAISHGARPDAIKTLLWGIDLELFKPRPAARDRLRASWGVAEGDFVVLNPRGVDQIYCHDVIAESVERLRGTNARIVLVVAARATDRQDIVKAAEHMRALGIEFRIIEQMSHRLMPDVYSAADAVVSFAKSDNVPRTILEAMACGVPVVARDLPDLKGLFEDRRHALLVDGGARELSDAIQCLVSDPDLCERLAVEGHKKVMEFADFRSDTAKIIESYRRIIGTRPDLAEPAKPKPLKICVLGSAHAQHVITRTRALKSLGHDVTLISRVPISDKDLDIGKPLDLPSGAHRWRRARAVLKLSQALIRQKADVSYAHYASEYECWLAALLRRRPLAINAMGSDVLLDATGTRGWIRGALTRFALHSADLITAKSPFIVRTTQELGVPQERVKEVIWGIDMELFRRTPDGRAKWRSAWGADDDTLVVLYPRPLEGVYQQHLLIEAMPALLARHPKALVVISTYREDPNYRLRLKKLIAVLGIGDRLIFLPAQPPEEMPAIISAADVVVSLAFTDGTPQTVLESQACEVPVLILDIPDVRDFFIDGRDCLYCSGRPEDIAAGIGRLSSDTILREHLIAQGSDTVRERADIRNDLKRVEKYLYDIVR